MSALMLALICVSTMVASLGILLYMVYHKKFKGFDGIVLAVVLTLFVSTFAASTVLGAYGFNTIRNGGSNGAGLSLSRD